MAGNSTHYAIGATIAAVCALSLLLAFNLDNPPIAVRLEKAEPREIRSSVLASGQLAYREAIVLSPEVIGKVSAILVREGQRVAKGEPLLQLDDHSLQAEVAEQRAALRQQTIVIEQQELALRNQHAQFARKRELHVRGMIADAALDDARFAFDTAGIELRNSRLRLEQVEAVLHQTEERLAKASVRAPIAGTVIGIDIRIGETAVPSQVGIPGSNLLTIANTDTIGAEIDVDEADIPRVAIGQPVTLHATAFPDRTIAGRVAFIALAPKRGPQGEAQGLHYNVRVALTDPSSATLRTGMRCRAEIDTGQRTKVLAEPTTQY